MNSGVRASVRSAQRTDLHAMSRRVDRAIRLGEDVVVASMRDVRVAVRRLRAAPEFTLSLR